MTASSVFYASDNKTLTCVYLITKILPKVIKISLILLLRKLRNRELNRMAQANNDEAGITTQMSLFGSLRKRLAVLLLLVKCWSSV